MPKISAEQREARREQILAAALSCFSRDGFHRTTTADVVRESGLSQGTLYLYFKSKDDLIAALADDRHQREAALNALAEHQEDPLKSIHALIRLYAGRLSDPAQTDSLRVGLQGWAEALRNERVRTGVLEGVSSARSALVRVIRRGQRTGVFKRGLDATAMAQVLIALFQGFVLQAAWEPRRDLEPCFKLVDDLVQDSLSCSR
ncbi:MAG TPA: TetR/AcrR family transcriptional regulator [Steroidobacteraceae bacterium]|jgi:AcrR family transcriptional regulator|nr:TetR/AcrR family transcriptional regulator [Steroidobacteraceae bacterium]